MNKVTLKTISVFWVNISST